MTTPSSPQEPPAPERTDVVPVESGAYANVRCTVCGRFRLMARRDCLPPPGPCARCRMRSPRTYWTADWEKEDA